ncbi:type 1 periplasmic binding fold superfamily protein [Robertkochia aurantiaca]|uniref:type 1 periplasmic binding fold superfamily protein n=1 Tax=Robertkochia aurantiaca TaxID=2873700 RepID=UPI001CC9BF54|nr:type 1 periplasmic binding fold superfamily protein [Robertkochia sp. 3YJGBD-33]
MKNSKLLALMFLGTSLFTSCSDDDTPEVINEEELITQVTLDLTEVGTGTTQSVVWNVGEAAPNITINSGSSYEVEVGFFDASTPSDVENITEEVIAEADEHQVFYEIANASLEIDPATDDFEDSSNNPVGIRTVWTGSGTTAGVVRVYLIHEPVSKTGNTRGDFGGETDVEADFNIIIN